MRIGIIGGDIAGLVAARILRDRGYSVCVFEEDDVGKSFFLPIYKYLERTTEVLRLLDELGLLHGPYSIQGGLHVNGEVTLCRRYLLNNAERAKRVHYDYYRKTRLAQPDSYNVKSIDDPEVGPSRHAIQCDYVEFVSMLSKGVSVVRDRIKSIGLTATGGMNVETRNSVYGFKRLIVSSPLWEVKRLFDFDIPDSLAVKVNVIQVKTVKDTFLKWDFVYTPYTPDNVIHRVFTYNDGYGCQYSGDPDDNHIQSDLNFLFPDGWYVSQDPVAVPGHLLPLSEPVDWPTGIIPVGKHARWDNKATVTSTIKEISKLSRLWHGNP